MCIRDRAECGAARGGLVGKMTMVPAVAVPRWVNSAVLAAQVVGDVSSRVAEALAPAVADAEMARLSVLK